METKKYRSRIKAWAIFFWCIDTSIADTLTERLALSALHKRSPSVWMLWNPKLQTKNHWKPDGNTHPVKEWTIFLREQKQYINARVKRIAQTDGSLFSMTSPPRCPCRALREVLFTTRWLLRTTRRVGKTTPGLVRTTPGLVRTKPGLMGRSFHNLQTLKVKRPKSYTPNFPHPKILKIFVSKCEAGWGTGSIAHGGKSVSGIQPHSPTPSHPLCAAPPGSRKMPIRQQQ